MLLEANYQRERRQLAARRKAAFAIEPTGANHVWQLDFTERLVGRPLRELTERAADGTVLPVVTIVTDNGGPFRSFRFEAFIATHPELRHVRTRVRTPGAERLPGARRSASARPTPWSSTFPSPKSCQLLDAGQPPTRAASPQPVLLLVRGFGDDGLDPASAQVGADPAAGVGLVAQHSTGSGPGPAESSALDPDRGQHRP